MIKRRITWAYLDEQMISGESTLGVKTRRKLWVENPLIE